jgi:hypothetical protein
MKQEVTKLKFLQIFPRKWCCLLPTSFLRCPDNPSSNIFDEPPIVVVLPTKNSHQEEKTRITKLSAPAS